MKQKTAAFLRKKAAGLVAVCMAAAMLPQNLPGGAMEVQAADGVIAQFSFDDDATGLQGGGAKGEKNGSGVSFRDDAVAGSSMYLDGSASWINVTAEDGSSLLTGKDEITISYFSKSEMDGGGWAFFAAPNANTQVYNKENYLGILDNKGSVKAERYKNSGSRPVAAEQKASGNAWRHVAVVVGTDKTTLYINGQETSADSTILLSDILGNASVLQIGKGNWGAGEYYKGYIDEMKIYDHAMTQEEVWNIFDTEGSVCKEAQLAVAEEELIAAMKAEGEKNALKVKEDITLPAQTINGTSITWTSSDPAHLTDAGVVTRPADTDPADSVVTLTAELAFGSSKRTVTFEVTVLRKESDASIVEWVKEDLELTQTKGIKGNITLPTDNEFGAVITWKSSNPAVISDKEVVHADYDNTPAGVVTRGDKEERVTLTATIQSGQAKATKNFDVTVAKKPEKKQLDAYLFTYFPDNSHEQIYFAAGKDALHYRDLNGGDPVLTSDIGDKGVRDPYIFRSAEGDHYYMIATDLKVQTTGWGDAQYAGSLYLVLWESDDLVNWTEPRLIDVGLSVFGDKTTCAWAPEAIYDEKTGEYVVFWASMTKAETTHQVVYYSKTRDFVHFTEAKEYINRGKHCIDTSMVKAGDKYYRVSADGDITIETSDTVLGDWKKISTLESVSAGMEGYDAFYAEKKIVLTGGVVEGLELFPLNGGNEWGLFVDNYGGVGYIPITTTDISDTTGSKWKIYASGEYNFGCMKRHGSIIGITQEEYDAVINKWTDDSIVNTEEEQKDPILAYDFEEDSAGKIADVSGHSRDGSLHGKAALEKDADKGGVLYLDGSTDTYAAFPTGFFDGRNKFTVSFDMKANTVSGNFFNFTVGKDTKKYLFLRARDKDFRLAITTGGGGSEEAATGNFESIANKWVNFTIVVDEDTMSVYRDGQLAGSKTKLNNRISWMGAGTEAYLGKSFYGPDAYVKGYYDNVKVYNRALTEAEIGGAEEPEKPEQVTLTYLAGEGGKIEGEAVQTVEKGKDGSKVTAVALDGYTFKQWSDGVVSAERADRAVQDSITVTAQFEKKSDIKEPDLPQPKPDDTVKDPNADVKDVTEVKLNKTKLTLGVKEKFALQAEVLPADTAEKTVVYTSTDNKVVSVNAAGVIKANKKGTAVITATAGGKTASVKVTVKKAPKKIALNAKTKTLKKGKSFAVKVRLPKGTASNKITYKSGKKSVVSVSSTGKIKALKKGKAVITVKTYNGKKATLKVTVK